MLSKNHKLFIQLSLHNLELLDSYSQPCFFEVSFNGSSQNSPQIPSPGSQTPMIIALENKFSFAMPINQPQEAPLLIQIKLREMFKNKKLAFHQIDLRLLHLPYHEWVPLANKAGLQARLLINLVYRNEEVSEPQQEFEEEKNPESKPLVFGRGTSWVETKTKEFKLDYYRQKMYLFGDDVNAMILVFDFETETLEKIEPPDNLQLMGYSMACGLPNGKIILTGGINHALNIIVPTCFCYDPVRNRAKVLSSMSQARYTHNLIQKGNYVYAIGGRYYGKGTSGVLEKCERYDLNNNVWTSMAPLQNRRCTAVAYIHEGFIYVAGGYQGTSRINSIERFSDEKNVWETMDIKLLNPIEAGCGVVLPKSGLLIYIGGQDDSSKSEKIYQIDLTKKECSQIATMIKPRILAHSALHHEKIYIFGGADHDWERVSLSDWTSEIGGSYQSFIADEFKTFASCVSQDYFDDGIEVCKDKIVIFATNMVFHYSRERNLIENKAMPSQMKVYELGSISLLANGYIMLAGGFDTVAQCGVKKTFLYNPDKNTAFVGASLLNGKWSHALVHYKGFVYSIGGLIKGKVETSLCERYNIKMNKWEEIEPLTEKRASPSVFLSENSIFCFGGCLKGQPLSTIERYEIQEDSWKLLEISLPFSLPEIPCFKVNSNEILFFNSKEHQCFAFNLTQQEFKSLTFPNSFYNILEENARLLPFEKDVLVIWGKNNQVCLESFLINEAKEAKFHSSTNHTVEHKVNNRLLVSYTLKDTKIFNFIDEISLQQDLERDSTLMIFVNSGNEDIVLEFNSRTEGFELQKLKGLEKPCAIFKHSKAFGLPDGKILITGGLFTSEFGVSVVNSAFIYNPFNHTMKQASPMNFCRFQHSIAGGYRFVYCIGGKKFYSSAKDGVLNSCERYDFRDDRWENLPLMEEAVFNSSACVLDRNLYVFGGNNGDKLSSSIQVLDKIKLIWNKIDLQLPCALESVGVLPLNYHEILLCGGHKQDCNANEVFLMDTSCMKLEMLPSLLHTRTNPKVAIFGRNIYVFGGNSMFSAEKAWLTDPKKLKWETLSSYNHLISNDLVEMSSAISKVDLESLKIDHYTENLEGTQILSSIIPYDKLYIFGNEGFPYILRLTFPSLIWEKFPKPENLQLWDYSLALTLPNGNIFITGGINSALSSIKNLAYLITINGDSMTVKEQPNLLQARYTHTMCYLNNYVYVMGGRYFGAGAAGVLSHCERFNLAKKEWKQIASLNMKSCTAVSTPYLNKVYLFGGYRGDGRNKHIERYNELTNIWENVPLLLNNPIEAEALIPLSSHEIVLLGGKDDFTEQKYVMVYDLERGTAHHEKEMLFKRILCKVAKFNDTIYVVGGHADKTCEMARIGEWNWTEFEGYEKFIDTGVDKQSLVKNSFAQSY